LQASLGLINTPLGRAVTGSSRRRLETFSKSRPPSSHLRDNQVITAPRSKSFGLKSSSPLYKLAEAEAQEARDLRREEQERNIAEKRRAREEHAAEKHRHYEQSLSYQSYIERQDKRSHRPTPSEQTLPRSKVGELTVTERPASHAIENLPQSFSSPPLSPALLKGVREILGSHRPSPIQALSLKYLFRPTKDSGVHATSTYGEHILASETGSGKTIAYLLPILQHLKVTEVPHGATHTAHAPRALVLAPTHELTRQLSKVAKSLVHAEGAKLRILCSSKKNIPSSGIGKSSMKLTARKLKYITKGEIEINRDDADLAKQGHAVDMLFTTPMRALEMVKGRGWDRVERDESSLAEAQGSLSEDNLATGETLANESTNVRDRRGKLPELTKEAPSMKYPREMELGNVEWVVVDEADVLFGIYTN
jgi:ATP-dependent RNA helicase MRH4